MKKETRNAVRETFSYEGSFYIWTGKFFDLIAISFFWLLGSLPVVTAGASFSAMYAAVSRSVRQDRGTMGQVFWRSYRQNLKDGAVLWLLLLGALFLLLLNVGIIWNRLDGMLRLFLLVFYGLCIAEVLAAACYAFPALSRFDMPVGWIVKLSFFLTLRHYPATMLLVVLLGAAYLLLLHLPLLALFVPGIGALLSSYFIEPILDRHMPGEGNGTNAE